MKPNKIPTYLTHKPIYAINWYGAIDGAYKNNTDVIGLSVGKCQWNSDGMIPSVKVWRYKCDSNRWSRQSEETTLTRALDMATLVLKVLGKHYCGNSFKAENTVFGSVCIEEMTKNPSLISELNDYLLNNKSDIETHIKMLESALEEYRR